MQTHFSPTTAERSRCRATPRRSCASAFIAASAPPRARPICCSATSSTARVDASTSSKRCSKMQPPRRCQDRQAHRPLPLLPFVHDHLSLRCPLYASCRPRPRPHRERRTQRPLRRTPPAPDPGNRPAAARTCFAWRCSAPSSPSRFRALLPGRLKGLVAMAPARIPSPSFVDRPGVHPAAGPTPPARRPAQRLRPESARPEDQRSHHPPAQPPRCRSRRCQWRRLLRCTHPPPRQGRRVACLGRRQHPRLETRDSTGAGLDHIVINTSGCGTTVKDYGFMFRDDADTGR